MKNHKRFCELYNVPITYWKHFDYYINRLTQSNEWRNLQNDVANFEKFEERFLNVNHEINNQKHKIINALEKYNFVFPNIPNQIKRINKNNEFPNGKNDKFYISFDLIKANYQALFYLDFCLPKHWETLCNDLEIHTALTYSKSLRQEILGHFNPKATSKLQNQVLLDFLKQNDFEKFGTVSFLSTDEVIIEVDQEKIFEIWNLPSELSLSFFHNYNKFDWHFKKSIFKYTEKGHKEFYTLYEGNFASDYVKLFKIPKKYYMYEFVKEVLKEPHHILDTYFVENGYLQQIYRREPPIEFDSKIETEIIEDVWLKSPLTEEELEKINKQKDEDFILFE